MAAPELNLDGFTHIPDGKVALVVTYLEMREKPDQSSGEPAGAKLVNWPRPDPGAYKSLFRAVGDRWLWSSRLVLAPEALAALLSEPRREVFCLEIHGEPSGLLEINYSDEAAPEIAFFGLVPGAIGGGYGKWLMRQAIEMVWSRAETERLWLHTCTADSPQALGFYRSCGFMPYKRAIEIADDPRLKGILPREAAPHVPVVEHNRAASD